MKDSDKENNYVSVNVYKNDSMTDGFGCMVSSRVDDSSSDKMLKRRLQEKIIEHVTNDILNGSGFLQITNFDKEDIDVIRESIIEAVDRGIDSYKSSQNHKRTTRCTWGSISEIKNGPEMNIHQIILNTHWLDRRTENSERILRGIPEPESAEWLIGTVYVEGSEPFKVLAFMDRIENGKEHFQWYKIENNYIARYGSCYEDYNDFIHIVFDESMTS